MLNKSDEVLDSLFSKLKILHNSEIKESISNTWATSHGINKLLKELLKDDVHIIDPDFSSVNSPASSESINAREGSIGYAETIAGYYINKELIPNGFIQNDGGDLKKPIIMIINTTPVKVVSELDTTAEGGNHWHCCVILPKQYKPKFGEALNNKQEIIYYLDSLYPNVRLPKIFRNIIKEGTQDISTSNSHSIAPIFPEAQIIDGITTNQQEGGEDCGWWAIYNALMIVFTGNIEYLNQFKKTSRELGYKLRTLFSNIDKQITIPEAKHILEKVSDRYSALETHELLAIQKVVKDSLKESNYKENVKQRDQQEKECSKEKVYNNFRKESKIDSVSYIQNLFNKEFLEIVNSKGEHSIQRTNKIAKKLLKIDSDEFKSNMFTLKDFEEILIHSLKLLKLLDRENFIQNRTIQRDVFSSSIFLAIATYTKFSDSYNSITGSFTSTLTIEESKIIQLRNIFINYYNLIKLRYTIIGFNVKNPVDMHIESIDSQIYQLIHIFNKEFVKAMSDSDTAIMPSFSAYINWHLDIYYLDKLCDSLKVINKINILKKNIFRDLLNKDLACKAIYRVCYIGRDILHNKMSSNLRRKLGKHITLFDFGFINNATERIDELRLYTSPPSGTSKHIKQIISYLEDMQDIMQDLLYQIYIQFDPSISAIKKLRIIEIKSHQILTIETVVDDIREDYFLLKQKHLKNINRAFEEAVSVEDLECISNKLQESLERVIARSQIDRFNIESLNIEFLLSCFCRSAELFRNKRSTEYNLESFQDIKVLDKVIHKIRESDIFLQFNYSEIIDRIAVFIVMTKHSLFKGVDTSSENNSYSVNLLKNLGPIRAPFNWQIPNFTILIGKNGTGKTALMNHLTTCYSTQLFIRATHLQEIDDAFIETLHAINNNLYLDSDIREICYNIEEFGAFPNPRTDDLKYKFPIIALLYTEEIRSESDTQLDIKNLLNEKLAQYQAGFKIFGFTKSSDQNSEIYFIKNEREVSFLDLSSGEKVLFTLISCAVINLLLQKELGFHRSKLLLFDEIDIHFHPSYTKIFLQILQKEFEGLCIIVTTHNPVTIALAEQQNIINKSTKLVNNSTVTQTNFVSFCVLEQLYQQTSITQITSAKKAISMISQGLLNVTQDISYVVVENEDDAKFYSYVYEKFIASSFLKSHTTRLIFTPAGVKLIDSEELDELDSLKNIVNSIKGADNDELKRKAQKLIGKLKSENDRGNGCKEVEKRAAIVEYDIEIDKSNKLGVISKTPSIRVEKHTSNIIWGLLDRDRNRKSIGNVYAIDVYSFENYLCMPLNLFYLIKRDAEFNSDIEIKEKFQSTVECLEYRIIHGSSENTQPLELLINTLTDFVIDILRAKIQERIQDTQKDRTQKGKQDKIPILKNLEQLSKGLSNGNFVPLELANGLIIKNCPKIFFEGLGGGKKGHRFLDAIGYVMYGEKYKSEMKKHIFGALERIPSELLPRNLLVVMQNLVASKVVGTGENIELLEHKEISRNEEPNNTLHDMLNCIQILTLAIENRLSVNRFRTTVTEQNIDIIYTPNINNDINIRSQNFDNKNNELGL